MPGSYGNIFAGLVFSVQLYIVSLVQHGQCSLRWRLWCLESPSGWRL